MTQPRVVFDCMVYLQALASPSGPAAKCFAAVDAGLVTLCTSHETLAEVASVLLRPELTKKFPQLTPERVGQFLDYAEKHSMFVAAVPRTIELERDPKDEKYVNLAIAVNARLLVTRDNDLLALTDPHTPEGRDFVQRFSSLSILTPPAFLVRADELRRERETEEMRAHDERDLSHERTREHERDDPEPER